MFLSISPSSSSPSDKPSHKDRTCIQVNADIDGEDKGDRTGYDVSLPSDGQALANGVYDKDGNSFNIGYVCVCMYTYENPAWIQVSGDIDGEASFDKSGCSVRMNISWEYIRTCPLLRIFVHQ